MQKITAEVSAWYQDMASGTLFKVVAVDEYSGTIEYQLLDGEVGEYDTSAWKQLLLAPAEAPEDWRTPYELNSEDGLYADQTMVPANFSDVLADIEPDLMDPDLGEDFKAL